jgi:hypothetical protein
MAKVHTGKVLEGLAESESVECIERSSRNLGDPSLSFEREGSCCQLYGETAMAVWKSDDFIVLRGRESLLHGEGNHGIT